MLRIADFINKVVGTRMIPDNRKGVVVMKLDVEVGNVFIHLLTLSYISYHTEGKRNCYIGRPDVQWSFKTYKQSSF